MVGDLTLELPEFVPILATLNCTSIDMGRTIWHPVGLMMTPSTNRSTVQLKMRLPARGEIPRGESLYECEECGAPIPQARREAIPGVRLCIHCQQEKDLQKPAYTGYNRRGSKDSQLR